MAKNERCHHCGELMVPGEPVQWAGPSPCAIYSPEVPYHLDCYELHSDDFDESEMGYRRVEHRYWLAYLKDQDDNPDSETTSSSA